jgi:hypothetical protein
MRTTRTITASLCAVLGAAALAGPAAAGQQGADDSAKANVYVPPAALSTATAAKANVYVPPAPLSTATAAKANVYVPPAALSTAIPAKANVYVPPAALSTANPGTDAPNTKPITRHVPATSAPSAGFDWGSAGIGAAVIVGALLIGLGAAVEARRRRQIHPAPIG